ncbi:MULTISPECIES: tripartite tricarboxylate transporter substrate binding protein [unclassified Acidovorax]|uniref:Bug family tripartite tricarboxylate transporter substrate binding protein n=1 Tax=unclassified Acidovorax TaxID=2684926 RepID=UPI0023DE52E5|nr:MULTISPECIES: tripartite tricarboxylate transporter substrate binding protein [unclassified Acidovorax]GKS97571.1 tripartite tricarboxylate transporter substrate binding protein [Acidovorax sp. SUPP2825]GKS98736.1 tripartite tricarboxylate transporter substrate binding protein [Acidovorax sp. SUPP3434]
MNILNRRTFFSTLALAVVLLPHIHAMAQGALPVGPITMIVGWPAGGPSDNVARLTAVRMSEALGQSIVIDNKGGAGGNIGSDATARAKPDGSTIMLATVASHGLNSALYPKLNHDPMKDFSPIGMITTSPSVLLVPTDSPFLSVADLLKAAQARPGKLNYGSGGVGSSQHLAGANFKKITGADVTHIPYKGTAPAMTDLMAGRVDFVLTTGAMSFIRSGKLRPLAVAARQRLPALPDVPTFEESGVKGFHTDSWYGLVAPAGTPRAALDKLNAALATALRNPEVQKQFLDQGSLPVKPMGVDEFWSFVQQQMPLAAEQVRVSGAKAE